MKLRSTLAAAAALLVNCVAPAMADDRVSLGMVGGWEISKHPSWCSGTGHFANGTWLGFNIGTTGAATIVIANDRWNIPKGSYPVVVSVDRTQPVTFTGHADGVSVTMPWNATADEVNIMSSGAVFRAKVGAVSYEYGLVQSAAMLRAVIGCVADLATFGNPFANVRPDTASDNPFAETASNPYRRM